MIVLSNEFSTLAIILKIRELIMHNEDIDLVHAGWGALDTDRKSDQNCVIEYKEASSELFLESLLGIALLALIITSRTISLFYHNGPV